MTMAISDQQIRTFGIVAMASVSLFVALAWAVASGTVSAVDAAFLGALRSEADPTDPLGPAWLESAIRDLTALGGNAVLILITLGATAWYVARGERQAAWLLLCSAIVGVALSFGLKDLFDRARPNEIHHLQTVYTASFPSGHAMNALIIYLNLGLLASRSASPPAARWVAQLLAATIVIGIGLSRVYLGVHWISDVVAGWLAGLAWVGLCWMAFGLLGARVTR
jgi:undecaprenyl-diphosphatase